jgi:hypothetical protein
LNKQELQSAFQRAGLSVPKKRLSGFFDEIDLNHDGFITFDEWRYVLPGLCVVGPPFLLLLCLNVRPQIETHYKVDILVFVLFDLTLSAF